MLVLEILKSNGKQVYILVNNSYVNLEEAKTLYKEGYLDNVVLVNNSYFKTKVGYNRINIKEVKSDVKRNENNLGQVSKSEFKSRCNNDTGDCKSKKFYRKDGYKEADKRGKRSSESFEKCRSKGSQGCSSKTIRHICLRLSKLGCKPYSFESPKNFHEDFHKAKLAQKNGACVDEHDLTDLTDMKLLRSDNGFVAVEKNGNINSVLRDVTKQKGSNFFQDLMLNAIVHGGYKLDCFAITKGGSNGGLAEMYSQFGFIPIVKDHFNRDFAPDNWDYERDGEPDVVFMYHCGDSIEDIIRKRQNGEYTHYLDYSVPYIKDLPQYVKPSDDYDWDKDKDDLSTYSQAKRYRDWIMAKRNRYK